MSGERMVSIVGWAAAVFGVLGFSASISDGVLPDLPAGSALPLHGLTFALGVAAALAAGRRSVAIDRARFEAVLQHGVTRDEVRLAHREAERAHRIAWTAFGAAPTLLAYWLAYELPRGLHLALMLPASPLVGFGLGTLAGRLLRR
jgi:hypothetical protein